MLSWAAVNNMAYQGWGGSAPDDNTDDKVDASGGGYQGWGMASKPMQPQPQQPQQASTPLPQPPSADDSGGGYLGNLWGFVKSMGTGLVQAGGKLALGVGQLGADAPSLFSNPLTYKEPIPADIKLNIFGKDITSPQRAAYERDQALKSGTMTKEQSLGGAAQDVLDLSQFMPGVGAVSKGAEVLDAAGSTALKTALKEGAITGTKYGAGYGAAGAMQDNQSALDVLKSSAVGAGEGAAGGAAVGGVIHGVGRLLPGAKAPEGEVAPAESTPVAKNEPTIPATTMADIRTKQNPLVALKQAEINPEAKVMQDIKPPESAPTAGATGQMSPKPADIIATLREENRAGNPTAVATKPLSNIDDIIKNSNFVDVNQTGKNTIAMAGGGSANAKARWNFDTGKGEIVLAKGASDTTKAHEFAHPLNYKLGQAEGDKFTTGLDKYMSGQSDKAPASLEKYVRDQIGKGTPEPQVQKAIYDTAGKMQAEIKHLAGDAQKNSSEEFAVATSKVLTNEGAHEPAPILNDFLKNSIDGFKATPAEVEAKAVPAVTPKLSTGEQPIQPTGENGTKIPVKQESAPNTYYHVTTPENAASIKENGFSGDKTYVFNDKRTAEMYAASARAGKGGEATIVPVKSDVPMTPRSEGDSGGTIPSKNAQIAPEDVIKETKKTIQVKTPSAITEGGKTPRGGAEIKSASINLDKLNTSDDVKTMIDNLSKSDKDVINEQRRGTINNKQLEELSSMTGIKTKDILNAKPGSVLNAENALAARKLMLNAAQDIHEHTAKMGVNPSAEEMSTFKGLVDRYRGIQQSLAGFRSEAGRLLQQFNIKASPEEYEMLNAVAKTIGDDPTAKGVAKALAPENIWTQGIKAGVDLRTVMMFTSPGTLEVKALGDFQSSLWALADKAGAETIRTVLPEKISKFLGFEGVAKGETAAHIQGLKAAFSISNQDFVKDMKDIFMGKTLEETEFSHGTFANPLRDTLNKLGLSSEVATKTDNYLKYPYQTFSAITNYFSKINFGAELYSQALRQAQVGEKLTGTALQDRVAELIKNPESSPQMYKNIMEKVQRATLLEKNKLAEGMKTLRDSLPFGTGKIFAPAVKIAANTESGMLRLSPLGALSPVLSDLKGVPMSEANRSFAYTRALYGTGISLGITGLVVNGKITGSQPPQGVPANSVQIGSKWYNYMKLGPLGELISNTANIVHDYGQAKSTPEFLGDIMLHGIKSFTDQPMISELSDFVNAVGNASSISSQGLGYYSNKIISSLVTGSVPNIVRTIAKAGDKSVRDTTSITNAFKNSIPGLRETLPEKIGTNGQPIPQEGSSLEKFFSPFPSQSVDNSKLESELQTSNFKLSNTGLTTVAGVKLDQASRSVWQKAVGGARNKVLTAIVNSDGFDNLPQFAKDDVLSKASSQVKALFDKAITEKMQGDLAQRKVMTKPEQKAFNQQLQGNLASIISDMGLK